MRWLYALCWAGDDQPGLLMEHAVAWFLAKQVLLPGVSTLERFGTRVRARVQEQRWHNMAGAFDAKQSANIARLFESGDGPALIEELLRAPRRLAPGEFMAHLERIDAIRALNLAPTGAPDAVVERLARSARKMRPATLARLPEPRRSASLAALFGALEGIAIDEGLELFDQLIDQTVKDAARAYVASRMRTSSCFSTTTTTFRCNKSWPELTPPRSRTPSNERDTWLVRPTIGISGNCAHRGDGSNDCSRDCWAASHLKRCRPPSQFVRHWHSLRTRPIGQRHR